MPLAAIYRGMMLANARFDPIARVANIEGDNIKLTTPIAEAVLPQAGNDVWLVNVGVDDRFELPALVDVSR